MAIQTLLVGTRQPNQTRGSKNDQTGLHGKGQDAALHFATISLALDCSSKGCSIDSGAGPILGLGCCQRIRTDARL